MKTNKVGSRAWHQEVDAMYTGRGARRAFKRKSLARKQFLAQAEFDSDPKIRSKQRVTLARARRQFNTKSTDLVAKPISIAHMNAQIVGAMRVARRIGEMGTRAAVEIGLGDKKKRSHIEGGLAATTTMSKSWAIFHSNQKAADAAS